jgi:hypothetical protein
MIVRAQEMYTRAFGEEELHAAPRMVAQAIEQSSWTDDEDLQAMWAGLLVSSCSRATSRTAGMYMRGGRPFGGSLLSAV